MSDFALGSPLPVLTRDLARTFPASTDLIDTGTGVTAGAFSGSTFTVAGWAILPSSNGAFCGYMQPTSTNYVSMFLNSPTAFEPFIGGTSAGPFTMTAAWHHFACIFVSTPATQFTPYIDGVAQSTPFGCSAVAPVAGTHFFLGFDNFGSPFTGGSCCDVAVWNIALTATQLARLASGWRANTIGANANLGGWWPIIGQVPELDASGNGNTGVITGTGVVSGPTQLQPY